MKNKSTDQLSLVSAFIFGLAALSWTMLLSGCNNVRKEEKNNVSSLDSNVIISKTYGEDFNKIQLFKDSEIKCEFTQVIDGSSCAANIYLYFIPQSSIKSEIINVVGQMKWKQNGQVVQSPFLLCHIQTLISNNTNQIADSSFTSNLLITEKFKNISGQNNSLTYNIEFCDSTYKPIPFNVDAVIIDLKMEVNSSGKTKQYNKTVNLDAVIHRTAMPKGYRND